MKKITTDPPYNMMPEAEKGRLVIISAPSGAGKSTIVNYLLEMDLGLEFSISATTRKPRGGEKDGREYYFLASDAFRSRIEAGEFVEWEEVYENLFYGTLKSEITRIWGKGKHVLFDVDVAGGVNLKKIFGSKAIAIFIKPPSIEELGKRLAARATDTPEMISERTAKASEEMKYEGRFDHTIINEDLQKAKAEALQLVRSFLQK